MRPVDKRKLLPEEILSHGLICREHEVLYDSCGDIALIRLDIYRFSIFIKNNPALRKIEVY